jgi:hypothetical protein
MAKKHTNTKKKTQKTINPHDAFFKGMFSKVDSSWELLPISYVTSELEEFFTNAFCLFV